MVTDTAAAAFFVAGGTLRLDAPSYVKRPADDELYELALAGEFCYVLTPRQMGKSSLMVRTAQRLQERGVVTAIIDLTRIGTDVNAEQWYLSLLSQLRRRLGLHVDTVAWWRERAALGNVQRFIDFVRDAILTEIEGQAVVFVDEIDTTLSLNFRDDFFAAIRAMYNARADDPAFQRLTFVLLGVASPPDLISDTARTPFNIGHGLVLSEFSRADVTLLEDGLEAVHPGQGEAILNRIYHWTNGHPYLTQRLCLTVAESGDERWTDERVDALVHGLFVAEDARKETNLRFVQTKILTQPDQRRLLALYGKVVRGKEIRDDAQSPEQSQLKLSGLVKAEDGCLRVRNEIYRQVFGLDWVRENMPANWALRIAVISTLLVVILAAALGFWWSRQARQTAEAQAQVAIQNFQETLSADVRITSLANLFQLPGYEGQARDLFFAGLSPEEQVILFKWANPRAVGGQLIVVVEGLYTGLTDDEQGNALLEVMAQALRQVEDPLAARSADEIEQWLQGRAHQADGEYRQAVDAYAAAIELNPDNPGTHFERGLAYAALGEPGQALADLERVLELSEGWQERVQSVVVGDDRLYSALDPERGSYVRLARLVPTPTSTPTYTPTPTCTPTPTGIPTPTDTPVVTDTPTPTYTPMPTYTPTSTDTPSPTTTATNTPPPTYTRASTRTPTPTLRWFSAPTPIAPPHGASFSGWNAKVVLTWSGVGSLAEDEYYVVRIPYDDVGGVAEFWRKGTWLEVPAHYSLRTIGFADRHYDWSVQVMRCTGNCDKALDDNTRKQGVAVGARSSTRTFYWHPDIGGPSKPTPSTGEKPTEQPTRPPTSTPS